MEEIGCCAVIAGHSIVAVPQTKWAIICTSQAGVHEAGFVELAGTRYVLVIAGGATLGRRKPATVSGVLTSRELQIACSVADGKGDKVIAYELGISEHTVREHVRRIFHKLNVAKRTALVARLSDRPSRPGA